MRKDTKNRYNKFELTYDSGEIFELTLFNFDYKKDVYMKGWMKIKSICSVGIKNILYIECGSLPQGIDFVNKRTFCSQNHKTNVNL